MIIIRNAHGSHNPREHMEMADFGAGVKILAFAILELSAL
jgi:acetylornithine deacetylase/succinyl-diaminopimelate desuccinylase-like protein